MKKKGKFSISLDTAINASFANLTFYFFVILSTFSATFSSSSHQNQGEIK